ncbi:MAG TPA: transaldolase family protein [Ktedonobacterales bacterium]|nr:transaldolase family protein [Ktedonobacterales bacterium]
MGLYVDSAFLPDVERVCSKLRLDGATTNPSILLAAAQRGQQMSDMQVLRALLEVCPGSIFMQPVGETTSAMQRMAEGYLQAAPERVVAKLPLTPVGMQVACALRQAGARFAFTCVFTVTQAYCGAQAGAQYIIPYFGRLRRSGQDACERIEGMARLLNAQAPQTRILAASIKNPADAAEALLAGAHDLTATPEALEALLADPLTDTAVAQFQRDWETFSRFAASRSGSGS